MRQGFGPRLIERIRRSDPSAYRVVEATINGPAVATLQTADDWKTADETSGFFFEDGGRVRLLSTALTLAEHTSSNDTETALQRGAPFFAAELAWSPSISTEMEVTSISVELDPETVSPQQVAVWRLEVYELVEVRLDLFPSGHLELAKVLERDVAAGAAAGTVQFSVPPGSLRPRAPQQSPINGTPTWYVAVFALRSDGTPAGNVAWLVDNTQSSVNDGGTIIQGVDLEPKTDDEGVSVHRRTSAAVVPRITVERASFADDTLEYTNNPIDLGTTPTGDVEVQVELGTPVGTQLIVEIDDNVGSPFAGGEVQVQSGDFLQADHGLALQQTYAVRFRFLTNAAADATPELQRFQLRELERVPLYDQVGRPGLVLRIRDAFTDAAASLSGHTMDTPSGVGYVSPDFNWFDLAGNQLFINAAGTGQGRVRSGTDIAELAELVEWRWRLTRVDWQSDQGYTDLLVRATVNQTDLADEEYISVRLTRGAGTDTASIALLREVDDGVLAENVVLTDELPWADDETYELGATWVTDRTLVVWREPSGGGPRAAIGAYTFADGYADGSHLRFGFRASGGASAVHETLIDFVQMQAIGEVLVPGVPLAEIHGGRVAVENLEQLKGNIPTAQLVSIHHGESDADDLITRLLSTQNLEELRFREYWVAPDLPRGEWGFLDEWEVLDWDPQDHQVIVELQHPMARLRGVLPVPRDSGGGVQLEPFVQTNVSLKTAAQNIVAEAVLPQHIVGPITEDDTTLVANTVEDSDLKDELDVIARLAGVSIIASQGKFKGVPMFGDSVIRAVFVEESITNVRVPPGLAKRIPEIHIRYGWDPNRRQFNRILRQAHGPTIDEIPPGQFSPTFAPGILGRWIPDSTAGDALADAVTRRTVETLATGERRWGWDSLWAYPELEVGDQVLINTRKFIARNPSAGIALKGNLWALARLVAVPGDGRTGFEGWVQSLDDIIPAGEDVPVIARFLTLTIPVQAFQPADPTAPGTPFSATGGGLHPTTIDVTERFIYTLPGITANRVQHIRLLAVRTNVTDLLTFGVSDDPETWSPTDFSGSIGIPSALPQFVNVPVTYEGTNTNSVTLVLLMQADVDITDVRGIYAQVEYRV